LIQAAVESTKQSKFECRGCSGLTEKVLIYSFQLSPVPIPADPCCCTAGHETSKSPTTPQMPDQEGHIAITAPPLCVCPDACTAARVQDQKFRSAKCLYLWKCGMRHFATW
jgi:hypothetical protein